MRSASQHNFAMVPRAEIPRSSFDRSCGYKTTFDAGWLIPIFVDEALPGDTFNVKVTAFCRLATPLHPFMDNMYLDTFFFAVPYRLIWDNWERFNGAQDDPGDSTDYLVPQVVSPVSGGYSYGRLADYFGIPTGVPSLSTSALPFRAYNLIYNEWFRDQNLQNSVSVPKNDGPDPEFAYDILRRGKRHDYFTSALPWPQKGPSVDIPLGTTAPVLGLGTRATATFPTTGVSIRQSDGTATSSGQWQEAYDGSASMIFAQESSTPDYPNIRADLTNATAATINQLRQAFQVQKLYERDARGGTRYTEIIRAHFGVVSPDARLQRPEYLGGGTSYMNVTPIAQTSSTVTGSPQANLAAIGVSTVKGHGFVKSFTEHCVIIGMVCARADLNYQQGLTRDWSRRTRFDFYWPELSQIGEQAVLNKEIYAQGSVNPTADEAVFGYQERYAEYRYKPSLITGKFRSSDPQSLDTWHLAQEFSSLPALNSTFIVENPPVDRVIAVPSEPHILWDSVIKCYTARPMKTYSVPGLIDHF